MLRAFAPYVIALEVLAWVDGQFPDSRMPDAAYFINLSAAPRPLRELS